MMFMRHVAEIFASAIYFVDHLAHVPCEEKAEFQGIKQKSFSLFEEIELYLTKGMAHVASDCISKVQSLV